MTTQYPDTEGFAYSFSRGELSAAGKIFTAIGGVDASQPTEESGVMGTRPFPIARTEGEMKLGDGTVTFSDEAERIAFIETLGNEWRSKTWTLTWILSAKGRPNVKRVCYGCRVLDEPVSHKTGTEALGGDVKFSFMYMTINGKVALPGLPSPTR